MYKKMFHVDVDPGMVEKFYYDKWAIAVQHTLGGFCVVPICVLGYRDSWAYDLGRHAMLMELGWELGDGIHRFYDRFLTEDGDKR
jgi:hypothetical protein